MPHKPEYQHYVPQFILRKYSTYVEPDRTAFADNKAYTKAQKRAKEKARLNTIDFSIGYANGLLCERYCHKIFGIPEMYSEEIEKALSHLEQKAAGIIKVIEADFNSGRQSTTIRRSEKDLLRKFLFIMSYRTRGFHKRFARGEDDYSAIDRTQLLQYMREKGFKTPKDVWLDNIRAFINVDMSTDTETWTEWLQQNAYPDDALWYTKHMIASYLCFCTPESAQEEFILTQNAYGVYEGPNSMSIWMDWHTFTPINPKLIIVLRNVLLDGADSVTRDLPNKIARQIKQNFKRGRDLITLQYKDPVQAQSWLQDMPVKRPATSYRNVRFISGQNTSKVIFSPKDSFTFSFFKLPSTIIQRINAVFLEEAVLTDAIVYKSDEALRQALEFYLTVERPGFKTVLEIPSEERQEILRVDHDGIHSIKTAPEYSRRSYLEMLERTARKLGSSCEAKYTIETSETVAILPPMSAQFMQRYINLGFDETVLGWIKDEEQGRLIGALWNCINCVTRSAKKDIEQLVLRQRLQFVCTLPPYRVWLHLRFMRLYVDQQEFLATANREMYMKELVSANNDGAEDIVADYFQCFAPEHLSRAMMRASAMSQWIELNTSCLDEESERQHKYLIATWCYVGSITDCDLPILKEAANAIRQGIDLTWWKRKTIEHGYPEDYLLEMWIREHLYDDFENLISQYRLSEQDVQRLKDFVFRDLYPLPKRLVTG